MTWTQKDMDQFLNKSFAELYGDLTVGQALELNKIAKETCGLESTAQIGEEWFLRNILKP